MKVVELHIPDDLALKVQRLTGNAEKFIIDLLRAKVDEGQQYTLADQYRLASAENEQVIRDFTALDLEGWDEEY